MSKKGFTLIELLVTIVIMALILILVMPSITALRNNNEKKKYEYYADSLVEAAKVYVNKEGEDINSLGAKNWVGCVDITYQDLIDEDLIDPFNDENIDCSDATVRYTKSEKSSNYKYNMTCINTSSKETVYDHAEIDNKSCTVIDTDDKTPPTCGTATNASTEWTKNDRTITISCRDDRSGCESVTKTFYSTTKVGYITIKDGNNNTTECPVDVYVDKSAPTNPKVTGSSACVNQPSTVSLNLSATENGSGIAKWQYGTSKSASAMKDFANSATNPYTAKFSSVMNQTIYFRACDKVGNCSDYVSAKVCIKKKTASIGGNAGKWVAIYNPRGNDGYAVCYGSVCGNVIGKLDISWSGNYGNATSWFGVGPVSWIGSGYYVNLVVYKNGSYYASYSLKDLNASWGFNSWPQGKPVNGIYMPTGTYDFYFQSNATNPNFNAYMARVVVS